MTPDDFTNQELMLDVGDGHQIYVHDWGNPKAKTPIIFLHGGPGNGCDDLDKQKFDPASQRVIFHDQRGSGKSIADELLKNNTLEDLVTDINKIVERLNISKFLLVGGSWGSTLSLVYAIKNPQKVTGLVIDGIFMASRSEIDWLDKGGWRTFYPEIWDHYIKTVPKENRDNPSAYHAQQALGTDEEKAKRSVYEYLKVELALLKLDDIYRPPKYDDFQAGGGKIELHYLSQKCFLPDNYILENAKSLTMPVRLIQGRYDMVCPPEAAHRLYLALPNSEIAWVVGGHLRQHEAKNIQKIYIRQLLEMA